MSDFAPYTTIAPEQRLQLLGASLAFVTGRNSMVSVNGAVMNQTLACKALYDVAVMRFLAADERLRELEARKAVEAIVTMARNDYNGALIAMRRAAFLGWGVKTDENGNVVRTGDGAVPSPRPS